MLNLMSVFNEKENLDIFFEKHNKNKKKIFEEIYLYLGGKDFGSNKDFKDKYQELLSHENNKTKILSSGLILRIYDYDSKLHLTDKNSTFNLTIDFLKRLKVKDEEKNKTKTEYIISKAYYTYYYNVIKNRKIKIKFGNNSSELSLSSDNLEEIIYNKKLKYLSSYPNYNQIYEDIFNILQKEKKLKKITPNDFFNDFRIINFPEIEKQFVNKIKWKETDFDDYCWGYKYLYYNRKIGLSVALQKYFIHLFQTNKKYFYCNVDFLYNEKDKRKIRNYIFFYLSFLFSIDEKNKFINFIDNNITTLINKYSGAELIKNLLQLLHQEIYKLYKFKLYIDNVKSKFQFDVIKNFMDSYEHNDALIFIQLNINTLNTLSMVYKYNLIENREISSSIIDDLEFYLPITFGLTDEKKIENEYSDKLKTFFEKYNYETYLNLLNIKYLIDTKDSYYLNLISLGSFFEFLLVKPKKYRIKSICFRNNYIKEKFNDNYLRYITKFKNIDKNIFHNITKLEEGIKFERQIIYDLITNNDKNNIIKVNKIFSIEKFPEIHSTNNKEYLFMQDNSNAPYYDIAFLYYENGFNVLKCCQIGINKSADELKKLNKIFLLFDLYYFCQKLKNEKEIKVDKIELCIITTKNAYDEEKLFLEKKIKLKDRKYPDFNIMKKFCENNGFIFLIFDTKNSEFCRFNNEKLEKSDLKYSNSQFDIKKIFLKDKYISETKKVNFYFNPKNPNKIGEIELPPHFNEANLNKEFNFRIIEETAIYEQESRKNEENENIIDDEVLKKELELENNIKQKYNENSESESMDEDYDDEEKKNSEMSMILKIIDFSRN